MATAYQCSVKCESYTNAIVPRIYDHLIRGTYGDCVLAAEGKLIRAHKLILSISSEYFEVSQSVWPARVRFKLVLDHSIVQ